MTFRPRVLAALIAVAATPVVTFASSSGLTQWDIEHGQTALLSERSPFAKPAPDGKEKVPSRKAPGVSEEQARHRKAMDSGTVRMTTGSMEGSTKQ